jgi:OmpW family
MNTRMLWKLASLSLVLSSSSALADSSWRNDGFRNRSVDYESQERSAEDQGFALGLRAGYGLPFGKFGSVGDGGGEGGDVKDLVTSVVPLQVDAGYFINSRLYVGANFQYGVGFLNEDCPEEASCRASQLRFGVNVAYHFEPTETLRPWVGLGVGYEMLDLSVSASEGGVSGKATTSIRGLEFAALQSGLDYRVNRTFSVGPFVTLTAGQYSTVSSRIEVDGDGGFFDDVDTSQDIEEKAFHVWLQGGVRMQVQF